MADEAGVEPAAPIKVRSFSKRVRQTDSRFPSGKLEINYGVVLENNYVAWKGGAAGETRTRNSLFGRQAL